MNDILFGNNNGAVIKKLAKRSFQQNKIRNSIAALAIFLTALLICTVFLIGGSYIGSWQLQQEQTRGTMGHATLNAPSWEQYEMLAASEEIDSVGVRADVLLPSFVNANFDTNGAGLFYGLRFYNTSEWENHRVPVLENICGTYPSSTDEIMVPSWVLEKWDITEPYIGMELPFSYQSGSMQETEQKSFRLSGWFNEYDYIGDGNIAYLLVSEAFCHEVKFDIWSNQETTADMRFSNTQSIAEVTSSIESSLKLSSGQTLSVNPDLLDGNTNFKTKRISPITALHYQNEAAEVKPKLKSKHFSASGMAWRNIQRTKKKSILAVLSIFLGITACLVVTLLIQSMSTDNFINSAMEHDVELTNQTLVLGYRGEQEQLFDENFINELYSIEGIGNISLQREQTIIPEYSEDMFYSYILDKYQSQGMEAPGVNYYAQYPNRFYTQLVSVDAKKLKDYIVEKGMDYEKFYNGDYGLLVADKPELFPSNQAVRFQCGHISEFEAVADGNLLELPIGGFLPSSYYGGLSTDAPYIFVSEAAMKRISPDAYISRFSIDVNSANEKQVISSVRELCNQTGAISITSKAELAEGLHSAKVTLYTLGGGIAFVLAFIGIINFANIMFTNIEARRHELSVMESIGMTKKQCRRMLQMEGFWYAIISLVLCVTVGNVVLFLTFQVFKGIVEYAAFSYPIWMIPVLAAILLAFCWFIPLLFANRIMKKQRLKDYGRIDFFLCNRPLFDRLNRGQSCPRFSNVTVL